MLVDHTYNSAQTKQIINAYIYIWSKFVATSAIYRATPHCFGCVYMDYVLKKLYISKIFLVLFLIFYFKKHILSKKIYFLICLMSKINI